MEKNKYEEIKVVEYSVKEGYKRKVDKCIAPLIKELNRYGVKTKYCCCARGNDLGFVRISGENIRFVHQGDDIVIDLLLSKCPNHTKKKDDDDIPKIKHGRGGTAPDALEVKPIEGVEGTATIKEISLRRKLATEPEPKIRTKLVKAKKR